MLRIHPFAAVRPAPGREARVASVPYDVVNAEEARGLASGNEDSFLHVVRSEIDLSPETDPYDPRVYEKARANFGSLRARGVLIQDDRPRLYLYRQVWRDHVQIGLVCCCHVDDYAKDVIKKHEKTRRAKEDDRTRHVLTVGANTGPVFLAYRDMEAVDLLVARDTNTRPLYHFNAPDGVTHTVWSIDDCAPYEAAFAKAPAAYVADGHHRAASAARAGAELRETNPRHTGEEEYNWFLSALFPASQLRILAYNRVVRDLDGRTVEKVIDDLSAVGRLCGTDDAEPDRRSVFCIYLDGEWRRLEVDPASIDVSDPIASLDAQILQDRVLEPVFGIGDPRSDDRVDFIGGIRGTAFLKKEVDEGRAAAAFSLYPTSIEQLMAVADAGMVMPPKSTWFEPKLRSGLLVHLLNGPGEG